MDFLTKVELGLYEGDRLCATSDIQLDYDCGSHKGVITTQPYCLCRGIIGDLTGAMKVRNVSEEEKDVFLRSIEESRQKLLTKECQRCWVFQEIVVKTADMIVKGDPMEMNHLEYELIEKKDWLLDPEELGGEAEVKAVTKEVVEAEKQFNEMKEQFRSLQKR